VDLPMLDLDGPQVLADRIACPAALSGPGMVAILSAWLIPARRTLSQPRRVQ
jgi:hypothetical protein